MCDISSFDFDKLKKIEESLGSGSISGFGDEIKKAKDRKVIDQPFLVKAHRLTILNVKHAEKGTSKDYSEALDFEKQVIEQLRKKLGLK